MGTRPLVARVTAAADRERAGLRRVLRGGAVNMAGAVVGAALNLAVIVTITRAWVRCRIPSITMKRERARS